MPHRPAGRLKYCLSCGAKQDITRRPRSRGNGTGSVYQLPSKTWIAVRICGWYTAEDGSIHRKTRSKSGFRTKKEALEYLPLLAVTPAQERSRTSPTKSWPTSGIPPTGPVSPPSAVTVPPSSTSAPSGALSWPTSTWTTCRSAWMTARREAHQGEHEGPLRPALQVRHPPASGHPESGGNISSWAAACRGEACASHGGRAGPPAGQGVYPPTGSTSWPSVISASGPRAAGAGYRGLRPPRLRSFVGGAKTEAGRSRIVTISPKIQPIIDRLVAGRTSGPVFVSASGGRLSLETTGQHLRRSGHHRL